MLALGKTEYVEPIQLPDLFKTSEAIKEFEELLSTQPPPMLAVYPNPASDWVILEYKLETETTGIIEITDINGFTLHSVSIAEIHDQVNIVTRDWKPGIYIASLKTGGKLLESAKFTITK